MKILKFGGSSVGNAERISKVIDILKDYSDRGEEYSVVFSAFQTVTDSLIRLGNLALKRDETYLSELERLKIKHFEAIDSLIKNSESKEVLSTDVSKLFEELSNILYGVFLIKELTLRSLDYIQSFGERLSCRIITAAMSNRGFNCSYLDTREIVKTDSNFGYAKVDFTTTNKNILEYFKVHPEIQIITGFIGSTSENETTTLGRGGSDYTASVFGAALDAEEIEIWTDVDGILTADPRKVKDAYSLKAVTYEEAMELSHFGAKVIYPPTMLPALKKKIKIRIKNTFNPSHKGTVILEREDSVAFNVKGISSIDDISLLRIQGSGMIGIAGISSRIFNSLAQKGINVILITQASSEHSICLAVIPKDSELAKQAIEDEFKYEIIQEQLNSVIVQKDLSVIAVVGEDMKNTPGIAGKVFQSLGKNGINIHAIAQGSSELNISLVIGKKDLNKALNALHNSVFLAKNRIINIYLVGTGLVGSALLEYFRKREVHLKENLNTKIRVIGIADINRMYFDKEGIEVSDWKSIVEKSGSDTSIEKFVNKMIEADVPNSIFVDCTSSQDVAYKYSSILNAGISIVTPNKLANSSDLKYYNNIRSSALARRVEFLYETNVGAALPVIESLRTLVLNGDGIRKIEGIFSGTLSYLFNNFRERDSFSEIVAEAKAKGYTEPDPRNDLNGKDMGRKLLILLREAGMNLEMADIRIESLIPDALKDIPDVSNFMTKLPEFDEYFREMKMEAASEGKVLSYIAKYEDGKACVQLEKIPADHPFASMKGSDNIMAFTTDDYNEVPLVIRGPGAGANITASGIFADILKISNYLGD